MGKYNVGDKFVIEIREEVTDKRWDDVEYYMVKGISKRFSKGELDNLHTLNNEEQYNKGLQDAWELARKIFELNRLGRKKVYSTEEIRSVIDGCSVQEALEKFEAYEKEKNEIKVGDVVICISVADDWTDCYMY